MLVPITIIPLLQSLNANKAIVLASGSPRRKELMQLMGFTKTMIRVSKFAENLDKTAFPSAAEYCLATALEKGKDVVATLRSTNEWQDNMILISADTIVEINDKILEKPANKEEAQSMLSMLSGNYHTVHTGVAIVAGRPAAEESIRTFIESTRVKFDALTAEDIEAYIATGEPFDKAGGYGIQGIGGQMVVGVEGCYFNVMGLPIHTLSKTLAAMHNEKLL